MPTWIWRWKVNVLLEAVGAWNRLVEGLPVIAGSWNTKQGAPPLQLTPCTVPDDWIANICMFTPVTFTWLKRLKASPLSVSFQDSRILNPFSIRRSTVAVRGN